MLVTLVNQLDSESFSENLQSKFEKFIERDGKRVLQWVGFALGALLIFFYFFFFKNESKNPAGTLDVAYYALSHATPQDLKQELIAFEKAMKANPEMIPNYEGKAAQLLLEKNAAPEAMTLINPLFHRVHLDRYPNYQQFSDISVEISEGDLQSALIRSLNLQSQMKESDDILAAHNLIRIAFLQKILKDEPALKATLTEINSILSGTSSSPIPSKAALMDVETIYNYKNLGLKQFLELQD